MTSDERQRDGSQDPGGHQAAPPCFALLRENTLPSPERLGAAMVELGFELGEEPIEVKEDSLLLPLAHGAALRLTLTPAQQSKLADLPPGLTSPPEEEIAKCKAQLLTVLQGIEGSPLTQDLLMCRATAAVLRVSPAIGAMFGRSRSIHDAKLWEGIDADMNEEDPPIELMVDLSIADEGQGRLSILTHGMPRYGRENFHIFAPQTKGQDAAELCFHLVYELLSQPDLEYPSGTRLGRRAREKHRLDRGPSPINPKETVMILRM
ncbi:MAG: hypothetical protein CSA62_07460 [Planctomycetota bacterium]|nr:MAG: hypothetical protein CSA62_07460 [Planctomycetota bacterium]